MSIFLGEKHIKPKAAAQNKEDSSLSPHFPLDQAALAVVFSTPLEVPVLFNGIVRSDCTESAKLQ